MISITLLHPNKMKFRFFLLFLLGLVTLNACGDAESNTTTEDTEIVTPPEPEPLTSEKVVVKGKAGESQSYATKEGEALFDGKTFLRAGKFRDGYAVITQMVGEKELSGVINLEGEEVIPPSIEHRLGNYDDGFFKFTGEAAKYGYIDLTGKVVIEAEYSKTTWVENNMVRLQKGFKDWGIMNMQGEEVTPFIYKSIGSWHDGRALVKKNKKYGYLNEQGEVAIDLEYAYALGFEKGIALVEKDGKIGFIDPQNEVKIDFQYDDFKLITDVVEDASSMSGYGNTNERFIMEEGYIIVSRDGLWGYIDTEGQEILPLEYTYVGVPSKGNPRVVVRQGDKQGSFDLNKREVSWPSGS